MSEQIKKGLKNLCKSEPLTFPGFSYVKQVEVEKLLEKVPERFDKKPEFMSEPVSKDATASKKSHVSKDVQQSESDKLLGLNSADNEKAECLATYIEDHYKRSIDLVSLEIISNVEHIHIWTHTYIIIYILIQVGPT